MSSLENLVNKFVHEQGRVTIDDVRSLLQCFGYSEKKNPGSHCVFHKKRAYPITVPTIKGKYVKKCYVKRIVRILGLEEYLESSRAE